MKSSIHSILYGDLENARIKLLDKVEYINGIEGKKSNKKQQLSKKKI